MVSLGISGLKGGFESGLKGGFVRGLEDAGARVFVFGFFGGLKMRRHWAGPPVDTLAFELFWPCLCRKGTVQTK